MTNSEFVEQEADGDRLVLWALRSCDNFEIEHFGHEYDWIVFRFGSDDYPWNPDDGWDCCGTEIADRLYDALDAAEKHRDTARAEVERLTRENAHMAGSLQGVKDDLALSHAVNERLRGALKACIARVAVQSSGYAREVYEIARAALGEEG